MDSCCGLHAESSIQRWTPLTFSTSLSCLSRIFHRETYALLKEAIQRCQLGALAFPLACPQTTSVNLTQAEEALLNHADANFSSVTTAGAPLPLWSSSDGTGYLFQGDEITGETHPVGGSGIDMSASIESMGVYLAFTVGINITIDPTSEAWKEQVEKNPIYA